MQTQPKRRLSFYRRRRLLLFRDNKKRRTLKLSPIHPLRFCLLPTKGISLLMHRYTEIPTQIQRAENKQRHHHGNILLTPPRLRGRDSNVHGYACYTSSFFGQYESKLV
jgi:hypothetical protein